MDKKVNLKDNIILAARELFNAKGYSETSMSEIIKKANTSKGNLYYHFESKETLYLSILEEDLNKWLNDWQKYNKTQEKNRLYTFAKFFSKNSLNSFFHQATEEFYASTFNSEQTTSRMKKIDEAYLNFYVEIVKDCQETNLIDQKEDPKVLGFILMSQFVSINFKEYYGNEIDSYTLLRKMIDIFLNGVGK
ncbi:TetR/AcrR family transcriptional regulator [Alkalicoccobacillus gibsonii]|uniref:TetR/AcrR family transcriptional regulator n=1 Tax=Alkalicoccobacillus gibsonii TaxID=79881 RepID=A0ABU9VFJ2_9BACI